MPKTLSSIDLHFLLKELKALEGGRMDKAYQIGKDEFYLPFHVSSKGKSMLYFSLPSMLMLTRRKLSSVIEPPQFCKVLRKYLGGARLKKIEQMGSERILKLLFDAKEGLLVLYVELFSRGNLILCRKDDTIISALFSKKWSQRDVRGGKTYELPGTKEDSFSLDEKAFTKLIKSSGKESLVKSIALGLGTGGSYAEELCRRIDIEKSVPLTALKPKHHQELYEAFTRLLRQKITAQAVFKGKTLKDITPVPFELYKDLDNREAPSFNEALEEHLASARVVERASAADVKRQEEVKGAKKTLDKQLENIKRIEQDIKDNEAKGNYIYEHYPAIKDLLSQVAKAAKALDDKEMKKKLKGHKVIKELNRKDKTVTVDL